MAAGILSLQEGYFSDWNNPSALPDELGDSLFVFGCEDGRTFGWAIARRCSDDRCEHAEHADTMAIMSGIPLDGYHGEVVCIYGGNFPSEKTCFERVN